MSALKSNNRFYKINPNVDGRDFVVGDLHGCYDELICLLEHVHFNYEQDRVFCVGDLIDRGPKSEDCLKLLREPWFFSSLGNHESMYLDYQRKIKMGNTTGMDNELIFYYEQLAKYEDDIKKIPLGYIIEHINFGKIFIVHGEIVPEHIFSIDMVNTDEDYANLLYSMKTQDLTDAYEKFFEKYSKIDIPESYRQKLLWSRKLFINFYQDNKKFIDNQDFSFLKQLKIVQNLKIFCGHNIVPFPMKIGQQYYIDTGAALGQVNTKKSSHHQLFSQFGHQFYALSMVDINTGICYGCVTSTGEQQNKVFRLKKSLYR